MEIRPSGTPITAAQRNAYSQTPDADFFAAYVAAYQAQASAGASSQAALLGETHGGLSALRGVDVESQAAYAAVLDKAYSSGGFDNARQFLAGLSPDELDVVRRNHCLAESIDVGSISEEGAENLLLPEGYSVDLNADGIDEVGAGRIGHFPPRNAPAAVKEAWFQATANMDPGQMMTYALVMHDAVYGLQIGDQRQGSLHAADKADSYRQIVADYLSSLEANKGMLAAGQYERDKDFFTRFQALLQAA